MGSLFLPRTADGLQIGIGRPPHRHRILRASPGAGKIDRFNEFSLISQHLLPGGRHRGAHLVHASLFAAAGYVIIGRSIGLTAAGIRANRRAAVFSAPAVGTHGIGPSHHRLSLQGLRFKGHRHLRQHHPYKIFIELHLHRLPGDPNRHRHDRSRYCFRFRGRLGDHFRIYFDHLLRLLHRRGDAQNDPRHSQPK